jgi:hypothetical protein
MTNVANDSVFLVYSINISIKIYCGKDQHNHTKTLKATVQEGSAFGVVFLQ